MSNTASPQTVLKHALKTIKIVPEIDPETPIPVVDIGAFRKALAYFASDENAMWSNPYSAACALSVVTKKDGWRRKMEAEIQRGDDARILALGAVLIEKLVGKLGGKRRAVVATNGRPSLYVEKLDWMCATDDPTAGPIWTVEDGEIDGLDDLIDAAIEGNIEG